MLARTLEAAGLSTVLVTNMPFWAERAGAPRTLAVEFPLGQPRNAAQQMRVIRQALEVLETADTPGTIVHSEEAWPLPPEQALEEWQPAVPSPLMKVIAPRFMQIMREQRRKSKATKP